MKHLDKCYLKSIALNRLISLGELEIAESYLQAGLEVEFADFHGHSHLKWCIDNYQYDVSDEELMHHAYILGDLKLFNSYMTKLSISFNSSKFLFYNPKQNIIEYFAPNFNLTTAFFVLLFSDVESFPFYLSLFNNILVRDKISINQLISLIESKNFGKLKLIDLSLFLLEEDDSYFIDTVLNTESIEIIKYIFEAFKFKDEIILTIPYDIKFVKQLVDNDIIKFDLLDIGSNFQKHPLFFKSKNVLYVPNSHIENLSQFSPEEIFHLISANKIEGSLEDSIDLSRFSPTDILHLMSVNKIEVSLEGLIVLFWRWFDPYEAFAKLEALYPNDFEKAMRIFVSTKDLFNGDEDEFDYFDINPVAEFLILEYSN